MNRRAKYSGRVRGCLALATTLSVVGLLGVSPSPAAGAPADNSVMAWGVNTSGQLGDGTTTAQLSPVPVAGLGTGSGVIAISSGGSHNLALKSDGSVVAWGDNSFGQLGDGTRTNRLSPVPVTGLGAGSGVVAVVGGLFHSFAIKADGSVVGWGYNATGQLGNGSVTTDELTPTPVTGLGAGSGVAAISADGYHALALKSDGSVVAWGYNAFGQLGDGTTTDKLTPTPVTGLGAGSGVTAVSASAFRSMVRKSDGSVLVWGSNTFGQLGDGTTTTRLSPVPVTGLGAGSGVVGISMGKEHAVGAEIRWCRPCLGRQPLWGAGRWDHRRSVESGCCCWSRRGQRGDLGSCRRVSKRGVEVRRFRPRLGCERIRAAW